MPIRVLTAPGVGVWCFLAPSTAMATSPGSRLVALGLGVVAPIVLLMQINRAIAMREETRQALPSAGDKERELLDALAEPLSERELEVLTLLASGRTNREISRNLFVTVGTIKSHTSNIYGNLKARNRTEALAKARSLELLTNQHHARRAGPVVRSSKGTRDP